MRRLKERQVLSEENGIKVSSSVQLLNDVIWKTLDTRRRKKVATTEISGVQNKNNRADNASC